MTKIQQMEREGVDANPVLAEIGKQSTMMWCLKCDDEQPHRQHMAAGEGQYICEVCLTTGHEYGDGAEQAPVTTELCPCCDLGNTHATCTCD